MDERIKNIIDKEIALTTGSVAENFEGYDLISGMVDNLVSTYIEQYISNYVRTAVSNYIGLVDEEDADPETTLMDIMNDLVSYGEVV